MTIDNNDRDKTWLLLIFVIIWAVLLLVSCSTEKKAQRKVSWLLGHDKLSEACARIYPNVDSISKGDTTIVFDTLYLEGEPEIIRDTVITKGDSVIKFLDKKCPKIQTITKTVFIHDTVYRDNTAKLAAIQSQLSEKDKQIKDKDDVIIKQQVKIDKNDKWRLWFFLLAFVNVLGIVFRLFVYKRPI